MATNKLEWLYDEDTRLVLSALHQAGTLTINLPEVEALYGVPQPAVHHPEVDTGIHVEMAMGVADSISRDPAVKYAVLVHDLGKACTPADILPRHHDHESASAKLALKLGRRCKVPTEWLLLGYSVAKYHTHCHRLMDMTPKAIARFVLRSGLAKRPWLAESFALACEADARGRLGFEARRYPQGAMLVEIAEALSHNLHLLDKELGWGEFVDVARQRFLIVKRLLEARDEIAC